MVNTHRMAWGDGGCEGGGGRAAAARAAATTMSGAWATAKVAVPRVLARAAEDWMAARARRRGRGG